MDPDNIFNPGLAAALMKLDPDDGEQILEYMKTHALLSREKALLQASVREQKKLLVENGKLKNDIEQLKVQLQEKQRRRCAKALYSQAPPPSAQSPAPPDAPPPSGGRRRGRGPRAERRPAPPTLEAEPRLDVSRLDMRVGRIVSLRPHPLVDSMCIQEVDVGEHAPRSIVSKLKPDAEQLQDALVVLLCNVRVCKLRGVASQARLLCCSAPSGHMEPLAPPTGSAPGDRVTCLSYPGDPDKELQPKQRVWECVQRHLQVDGRGVANYRGCGCQVKGKGLCRAPSLTHCPIT